MRVSAMTDHPSTMTTISEYARRMADKTLTVLARHSDIMSPAGCAVVTLLVGAVEAGCAALSPGYVFSLYSYASFLVVTVGVVLLREPVQQRKAALGLDGP